MDDKNKSLDDLIGTTTNEPLVIKSGGDDKKFLYTILILLVLLFMVALGVIAFLGGKYFSSNSNEQVTQNLVSKKVEAQVTTVDKSNRAKVTQVTNSTNADNATISELENLVNKQTTKVQPVKVVQPQTKQQNTIANVASAAAGGKNLSQDDLAKIAKLVAQELAKAQAPTKIKTNSSSTNKDAALVNQLSGAQTDTLKNEQIQSDNLKDVKVNKSSKKVDTFNKVVVKQNSGGDDELAKLSSEIDAILQTEEVKKEEKSFKYKKALEQDVKERQKELRFIVVKKGDTLSSLAYKAYGRASAYTKIYAANPGLVKNPNRIYIGMKLRVPVDSESVKQKGN